MALAILLLLIVGIAAAIAYTVQQKEDQKNQTSVNPDSGEVEFPKTNMEIAQDFFMGQGESESISTPDISALSPGHFERPGWQDNVVEQVPVWVNDNSTNNIDLGITTASTTDTAVYNESKEHTEVKKLTRPTKRQPKKRPVVKTPEKKYSVPTTKKSTELKPKDFVKKTKEIGNPIAKVVPGKKKVTKVEPIKKVEPVKKVQPVVPIKPKKKK